MGVIAAPISILVATRFVEVGLFMMLLVPAIALAIVLAVSHRVCLRVFSWSTTQTMLIAVTVAFIVSIFLTFSAAVWRFLQNY